jgi:hypothetical protein
MTPQTLLGAIGVIGTGFKAASNVALLAAVLYLVDCRISNRGPEALDRCWMTALPIAGLGAAGRGGYALGFNTLNPALRPEDGLTGGERDERGRIKGRQP